MVRNFVPVHPLVASVERSPVLGSARTNIASNLRICRPATYSAFSPLPSPYSHTHMMTWRLTSNTIRPTGCVPTAISKYVRKRVPAITTCVHCAYTVPARLVSRVVADNWGQYSYSISARPQQAWPMPRCARQTNHRSKHTGNRSPPKTVKVQIKMLFRHRDRPGALCQFPPLDAFSQPAVSQLVGRPAVAFLTH